MLLALSTLAHAAPGARDIAAELERADDDVKQAFLAALLDQTDARPIGAFQGDLVYLVDVSAALAEPSVSKALDLDLSGQIGLVLLPPQLVREVGASFDDDLIALAEATAAAKRTDDFGATAVVVGGAILLWGIAIDTAYDTFWPAPPEPAHQDPATPPGNESGPVDTTPHGCKSTTDCNGDGESNFYDDDDDGDGVPDLEPDLHPYNADEKVCDLCGGTPYPQGAFSFFVGSGQSAAAEAVVVGFLGDTAGASPIPLGSLDGGAAQLLVGGW